MTRQDYLDLSLTLLGVILAAVTIFLAIAALFAYYDVRRAAERMAEQTTMDVIQRLSQGDEVSHGGTRLSLTPSSVKSGTAATLTAEALGEGVTKEDEQEGV